MNPNLSRTRFSRRRRTPAGSVVGVPGFLAWLEKAHPAAFERLKRERPELLREGAQLGGLGQAAAPGVAERAASTAQRIASAVLPFLQLDAQRKLLRVQVERASNGLPPIDASQFTLPPARFEVDAGSGLSRWGLLIAGGLALAFVLSRR